MAISKNLRWFLWTRWTSYLTVIDRFSYWINIYHLPNTATTGSLLNIFAIYSPHAESQRKLIVMVVHNSPLGNSSQTLFSWISTVKWTSRISSKNSETKHHWQHNLWLTRHRLSGTCHTSISQHTDPKPWSYPCSDPFSLITTWSHSKSSKQSLPAQEMVNCCQEGESNKSLKRDTITTNRQHTLKPPTHPNWHQGYFTGSTKQKQLQKMKMHLRHCWDPALPPIPSQYGWLRKDNSQK